MKAILQISRDLVLDIPDERLENAASIIRAYYREHEKAEFEKAARGFTPETLEEFRRIEAAARS